MLLMGTKRRCQLENVTNESWKNNRYKRKEMEHYMRAPVCLLKYDANNRRQRKAASKHEL